MKDLQAFFEDLATNESLAKKIEGVKENSKIVEIARKEGYEFTKNDFDKVMLGMVSGGFDIPYDAISSTLEDIAEGIRDGESFVSLVKIAGASAISQAVKYLLTRFL